MAKLPIDAEFALHEFSVRYREGLAKAGSANALQNFLGAVKEQYAQEQQAQHEHQAETPEASHQHDQQREIDDPEAGQ